MFLVSNLITYFQLVSSLRHFLREPLSLDQCREIVNRRMEERGRNFLRILKKGIYEHEESPYLKLLELAGCEFGDIRSSVSQHGIVKTLQGLREEGVYVTYDEFKGRKEVIREGRAFRFERSDFNNPCLPHYLTFQTGGTTGAGVKVTVDFEYMALTAVYRAFLFDIYALRDTPVALWFPILPGAAGVDHLLGNTKVGKPPPKWFSQVDREHINPSFKHKFRTNGLVYAGKLLGGKFPRPQFVDLKRAVEVARWIEKTLRRSSGCCIGTYCSSAVRICHAAREAGLDIEGTKFVVSGEPLTKVKHNEITSVGAEVINQYAFAEAGSVGFACAKPAALDEVHFLKDSFAMIQHERNVPYADQGVDAFLFTSLLDRAPKILLNVEVGDCGVVEDRKCGCGFEDLGFDDHLHTIRSFEKLTSEGMNIAGIELIRIIEEVLPQKYGGASTDYQIVEEEDERGFTRLSIAVSPTVKGISERNLLDAVQSVLEAVNDNVFMPEILTQADTFRVKRIHPLVTERGKTLPLYIKK